jgi:nicotinamide riboside transporter PnuC
VKYLAAIVLVLHGFAHLVGLVGAFGWSQGVPHRTTVLAGRADLGEFGIRVVGTLWAVVALAFAATALGIVSRATWTSPLLLATTLASLALCAIRLPEAKIGLVIDIVIIAVWIGVTRLNLPGHPR